MLEWLRDKGTQDLGCSEVYLISLKFDPPPLKPEFWPSPPPTMIYKWDYLEKHSYK